MPKAYSYLRFSTAEQMKGDSHRRQAQLATDYAEKNRLDLDTKLTFKDLGLSAFHGKNVTEGRLGEFKDAVRSGLVEQGSYLLVESLDRISRQTARKAVRLLEDICELGITVVTLCDGKMYDTESMDADPTSLLFSLLIFMRAHEESETKSKRISAAWSNKRANASTRPLTSRAPAWLILDRAACSFSVIPARAMIIRRIFSEYLQGTSPQTIANNFNREGLPAWGVNTKRPATLWHKSYICKILETPAVVGTMVPHRLEHIGGKRTRIPLAPLSGYFPTVVSAETFSRVQELRNGKGMKGRKASQPLQNVLAYLSTCPLCGSLMIRINKGSRWQYLVCSKAKAAAGCSYRLIPYQGLEDALVSNWEQLLIDRPGDEAEEVTLRESLRNAEEGVLQCAGELSNIMDMFQAGLLKPSPTVNERIRRLEVSLEEAKREEERLRHLLTSLSLTVVDVKLKELGEAFGDSQEMNRERINSALRGLFSQIIIDYDSGDLVFHWKHSEGSSTDIIYNLKTVFSA